MVDEDNLNTEMRNELAKPSLLLLLRPFLSLSTNSAFPAPDLASVVQDRSLVYHLSDAHSGGPTGLLDCSQALHSSRTRYQGSPQVDPGPLSRLRCGRAVVPMAAAAVRRATAQRSPPGRASCFLSEQAGKAWVQLAACRPCEAFIQEKDLNADQKPTTDALLPPAPQDGGPRAGSGRQRLAVTG